MIPAAIGIDGGCPGGAVQIDGDGVLLWAAFWDADPNDVGKLAIRIAGRTKFTAQGCWEVKVWRAAAVHALIGSGLHYAVTKWGPTGHPRETSRVAIEATFVGPNKKTTLDLTWQSAAQAARLEAEIRQPARRYLATTWRREVLGLDRKTSAAKAKAASVDAMPAQVDGLAGALDALNLGRAAHHVTDAAGVACCLRAALRAEGQRRAS